MKLIKRNLLRLHKVKFRQKFESRLGYTIKTSPGDVWLEFSEFVYWKFSGYETGYGPKVKNIQKIIMPIFRFAPWQGESFNAHNIY